MQLFFSSHAQLVTFITLLLPPALIGLLHAIYYVRGRLPRGRGLGGLIGADGGNTSARLAVLVPIKGEPPGLVLGLIKHLSWLKSELGGSYVVAIVCDDPPEEAARLRDRVLALAAELGLNVSFMIRRGGGRGRAAALNWALARLDADVVVILDVDSRPRRGYFSTLVPCVKRGHAACVSRWEGYWLVPTKLALSVSGSMKFLVDTLYRGRFSAGGFIYPLGSGTAFDMRALRSVGLWDEGVVQDDMHMGTKLFGRGYSVGYADGAVLRVLVPSKYLALKIQQRRWAYGAVEALLKGIKYLRRSPYPALRKVEAALFLMQYVPQALLGLALIAIPAASLALHADLMTLGLVPAAALTTLLGFYGYTFYLSLREAGLTAVSAVRVIGSSTALMISLSISVLIGTLAAFLRLRPPGGVTPKGESEARLRGGSGTEAGMLAYLACAAMLNAALGNLATAAWVLLLAAPIAYTLFNSDRIVGLEPQPGLGSSPGQA